MRLPHPLRHRTALGALAVLTVLAAAEALAGPSQDAMAKDPRLALEEEIARLEASLAAVRQPNPFQSLGSGAYRSAVLLDLMGQLRTALMKPAAGPHHQQRRKALEVEMLREVEAWKELEAASYRPYLAQISLTPEVAEQRRIVEQFLSAGEPAVADLEHFASAFSDGGRPEEGAALLSSFLDRLGRDHPQRSPAFAALVRFRERQSSAARATVTAQRWVEAFPADPNALRAWIRLAPPSLPRAQLEPFAHRLLTQPLPKYDRQRVCRELRQARLPSQELACLQQVAELFGASMSWPPSSAFGSTNIWRAGARCRTSLPTSAKRLPGRIEREYTESYSRPWPRGGSARW